MSDPGITNSYPRLLVSVTRRAEDGAYLGASGVAHPDQSGPEALDAAIDHLLRLRDQIHREPFIDWHIQINVRPK